MRRPLRTESELKFVLTTLLTIKAESWNFKILMTISTAGTGIFLSAIATYSYLSSSGLDLSHLAWIPVISLSLVIFLASLGIISLPIIITTELLPNKVRKFFIHFNAVNDGFFSLAGQKRCLHGLHELSHSFCFHHSEGIFSPFSHSWLMQWNFGRRFSLSWCKHLSFTPACGSSPLFVS